MVNLELVEPHREASDCLGSVAEQDKEQKNRKNV